MRRDVRAIAVIGMHRSGTSVLSRSLAALGVAIGDHSFGNEWNPRGYFEHPDIVRLNDRLLSLAGRRWDSLTLPPWSEWAPLAQPYEQEALAILERDFGKAAVFAFKDPRASRILPFWQSVFRQAGIDDSYVISLRHPMSVARSLAARDGTSTEKSYLLWLLHMYSALRDTAGRPRIVVDYDALIAHPRRQLERLAGELRLPAAAGRGSSLDEFVDGFLSASLRHSEEDARALRGDPRATESVCGAWDLLRALAGAETAARGEALADAGEWKSIGKSLDDSAPLLRYLDACESRIDELALKARRPTPAEPPSAPAAPAAPAQAAALAASHAPAPKTKAQPAADRVSIVIPLYNHERYVEEALRSIFAQTVQPAEIIIVDDGSTDASAGVVRRLCKGRRDIVFWSWPNQGAHHALNAAIHRATGEFVAILNSDDRYHPDRIAECLAVLRSDPSIDVVASEVAWIGDQGESIACEWYEDALTFYRRTRDLSLALCHANFLVTTSNLFVRRNLFESIGYFSALRYTHDLEFFLRLVLERRKFRFLERALLDYRVHGQNTISESTAHHDVERAALLAFFIRRWWLSQGGPKKRSDSLQRYVEVLGGQKLLDLVEYFLAALADGQKQKRTGTADALQSELAAFLARLHIDPAAVSGADAILDQFVAARNDFLRRLPDTSMHRVEIDRLYDVIGSKDEALLEQVSEIHRLYATLTEKELALQTQAIEIQRIDGVLTEKEQAIATQALEIQRIEGVLTGKEHAIVSQTIEIQRLNDVLAEKDRAIATQAAEIQRLYHDMTAKDQGLSIQGAELQRVYAALAEKDRALAIQASEIRRLEDAVAAKSHEVSVQGVEIDRLLQVLAEKEAALVSSAGEIGRISDVVSARDEAVSLQAAEIGRLHDVLAGKDQALQKQAAEIRRLEDAMTAKGEEVSAQGAEIGRLHHVIADLNAAALAQADEAQRLNRALAVRKDELAAQAAELERVQQALAEKERAFGAQANELRRLHDDIAAKSETAALQAAEIGNLREFLRGKDEAQRSAETAIRRLNDALAAREGKLSGQEAQIRGLHETIAERERAAQLQRERAAQMQAEEIQRINAVVVAKDQALDTQLGIIRQANATIEAKEDAIAELNDSRRTLTARAVDAERELASLRNTAWQKLGHALYDEKLSLRKIGRVVYYSGASLTPERLKPILKPLGLGLRGPRLESDAAADGRAPPRGAPLPPADSARHAPAAARRPRVLHVIANFMLGGSSRLVMDLVEGMGDAYEQKVVTSFLPSPPAYAGADVTEFRSPQSPEDVRPFLLDFRPSLVHVHYWGDCDRWWYDIFFRAVEPLGCRVIENVNTPVDPYDADFVDRYVYVSRYVHDRFGNGIGRNLTIYPGSDLRLFSRNGAGHPPRDCIGMVYRLEGDKLNEQSIDAFIKVARRRPQTKAIIVGGGTFLEPYRHAVRAAGVEGNFEFTGYVDYAALPKLYERMTAFVAPVWKESFGQVGPFAMSMGIPVLGYDVGGVAEIVDDPTLLATPGDSDALANLIIELLDDPARCARIGARNRERARGIFSVEAMIESYRALYGELLATPPHEHRQPALTT